MSYPIQTLSPFEAAKHVFDTLVEFEQGEKYIRHIQKLYIGDDFTEIEIANCILVYGELCPQWFEVSIEGTHDMIRLFLLNSFGINLTNGKTLSSVEDFMNIFGFMISQKYLGKNRNPQN